MLFLTCTFPVSSERLEIHNNRFSFWISQLNSVQKTKRSQIVNLFGLKITKLQHKYKLYEINLSYVVSCSVTVFDITSH